MEFTVIIFALVVVLGFLALRPRSDSDETETSPIRELNNETKDKINNLLANGKKVEAIRELRIATGLGLKVAKDVVDAAKEGNGDLQALVERIKDKRVR